MATVIDVAKYILSKMGSLTTMKLQKLCYYAQAWNLVWEEVPLFDEDFEAWANGPVCPVLYGKHKGIFKISEDMFNDGSLDEITDEMAENIDLVLDFYGDKEPFWLSNLTHQEQPWVMARDGYGIGESCSVKISKESMQVYYSAL